jgi:hypothetical protein
MNSDKGIMRNIGKNEPGCLSMTFKASVPADARRGGNEAEKQYPAPDSRCNTNNLLKEGEQITSYRKMSQL